MLAYALTGLIAAVYGGLRVLGRRLEIDATSAAGPMVVASALLLMLWIPEPFRSIVLVVLAVLLGASLGGAGIAIFGGIALGTALFLPGGTSVLVLAIVAGAGILETRAQRRHLQRISRAQTLVANEPVPHEVELTGKVRAVRPVRDPLRDQPCALWEVWIGGERRTSDAPLELRGEGGSAIVDPRTVELEWEATVATHAEGSEAEALARRLGVEPAKTAVVRVLPEDHECYVIGKPTWELAPAGCGGLYRDQPVLPTFRGTTKEQAVWFCDRSETQLRRGYTWALASWIAWSAVSGAIAIVQLGGWA